jgi:hypothetical protein
MREINDRLYMFRYNAIFFNATYEKIFIKLFTSTDND